jgi:hypothetical protein
VARGAHALRRVADSTSQDQLCALLECLCDWLRTDVGVCREQGLPEFRGAAIELGKIHVVLDDFGL